MSLFISRGDRSRPAKAADCATILTAPKAYTLYNAGYRYVGRYLTGTYGGGISKALTKTEAQIIIDMGLRFWPIYQQGQYSASAHPDTAATYFTVEKGQSDAENAIAAATALGIPSGTTIYFAVDFDAMDHNITNNVIPYFRKVNEIMSASIYKTGIYGARNVCSRVSAAGYSSSSFVANMSTGWSGNLGFKMPSNWAFDQFADRYEDGTYITISSPDGSFEIDKNGFSGRDYGVGRLEEVVANPPTFDPASISFGPTETETLNGPSVNILGWDVTLFTMALRMAVGMLESPVSWKLFSNMPSMGSPWNRPTT